MGEVGCRRDADEPADKPRAGQGGKQHDPATHAGADQDGGPANDTVEHGERIDTPVADAGIVEPAIRCPMAAIVEAQEGLAGLDAMRLEMDSLGPGHVGAEAGQKHDARRTAGRVAIGQGGPSERLSFSSCICIFARARLDCVASRSPLHAVTLERPPRDGKPGRHVHSLIASRQPAVLQLVPRLDADEIGRETLDLARHLRARGWRSLVASGGGSLLRELTAAGVTHLPVPLRDEGRLTRWRSAGRLARAIREHRVALVHAQAPSVAATGLDAARSAAVPLVASLRDLAAPSRASLDALAQVDRLIVASEYLAEAAVERVRVTTDRVRVVRRWVDLAEFDPERVRGHRVSALAERWGLVARCQGGGGTGAARR